jgi:hypothetical protein
MATRIRASCDECGDVELRVDDVVVRVCIDDDAGSYVFRCPSCEMSIVKHAEPRVVELLVASGVEVTAWSMPAELSERPVGPAFTHDDLLDFHELLESDDWQRELLDPAPGGSTSDVG